MSRAPPMPRRNEVPNQRERDSVESTASTVSRSSRSGCVPSASMRSVPMKEA